MFQGKWTLILMLGLFGAVAPGVRAGETAPAARRPLSDILGVCHINGIYHFPAPGRDFINEGADEILKLGSRCIKLIIRDQLQGGYYPFDTWPEITSLVQAAQLPAYQKVFAKPITTYVLMTFTPGAEIHYFTKGLSTADAERERRSFYDFTKFLLTRYAGTGKTFVLQNWEGDWVLTPPADIDKTPDPVAIQGMIDWLNARQDGVDRARAEVGMHGVRVFNAAEANLLIKAMEGKPCVTNSVFPKTHCDLYSYSAYQTLTQGPVIFRKSLDYLASKTPDSKAFGDKNIYLGEYGWPEKRGRRTGPPENDPRDGGGESGLWRPIRHVLGAVLRWQAA